MHHEQDLHAHMDRLRPNHSYVKFGGFFCSRGMLPHRRLSLAATNTPYVILSARAFFFIVAMLSLSTVISIINDSPPAPFGTEHVSGILSSWGPVLVFGMSDCCDLLAMHKAHSIFP